MISASLPLPCPQSPRCPACRAEGPHETDSRGVTHCHSCKWLFVLGADGAPRDLFAIARAGRSSRRG